MYHQQQVVELSHTLLLCNLAHHPNLSKSNALNLHRDTLGQFLDSNAAASRLVGKVLFVRCVHLGKVAHVGEEDGRLFALVSNNLIGVS